MKKKFIFSGIFAILFALLLAAVKLIDVAPIGPANTSIGLSHVNGAVHTYLGESELWYDLTEILGFVALALIPTFAIVGLIQLIKRKSILAVDPEILSLGCIYTLTAATYVLFELVVINYRPIATAEPEASFPSSHTMLACVVLVSAVILAGKYIKPLGLRIPLQVLGSLMAGVTAVGRLLSGVHWLTDIVGGVLISAALVLLFAALSDLFAHLLAKKKSSL